MNWRSGCKPRCRAWIDLKEEPEETRKLYGIGDPDTDAVGRRCLLARRLVEQGVRFVQVYASGWDSHDYIREAHKSRMRATDRPIAGLLQDLKRRGLLDSTLVIVGCAANSAVHPTTAYGAVPRPGVAIIIRVR